MTMERRLHLLESFDAKGSDGNTYRVRGYEQLVRDPTAPDVVERWEPTGVAEYRLDDGRPVAETRDGTMRIIDSGGELSK
jgi:hypothetical protein